MGFELITYNARTPRRLYALVQLVARLGRPTMQEVFDFLQPPEIKGNQDAVRDVYRTALACELIDEDAQGRVQLCVENSTIVDMQVFRQTMQRILLRRTREDDDFYLLNQIAAWYAVQGLRVFELAKDDIEVHFNREMYPHDEAGSRALNTTKLNAWLTWAAFLGWGWPGPGSVLVPDAANRLQPLLADLLPAHEVVPFGEFMRGVAARCPELDGGELFEDCWRESRGGEVRSNTLSLMISTGLRALAQSGHVELHEQADASDTWHLFPAPGHPLNRVTHIQAVRN